MIRRKLLLAGLLVLCLWPRGGWAQDSIAVAPPKNWSLLLVPLVFYTPATDWSFGPAAFLRYQPQDDCGFCNASFMRFYGYYTLAKQSFIRLDGETWFRQNDYKLRHDISYAVTPYQFFGLGNRAPSINREDFSQDRILVRLEGSRRWIKDRPFYGGVLLNWQQWRNVDVAPGGLLDAGTIEGHAGGDAVGVGMLLNFDTRDNVFFSRKGWYVDGFFSRYSQNIGSDFSFSLFRLDIRHFWPVGERSVLAWQGFTQWAGDKVPFQLMSGLGSENWFRGVIRGRYLDQYSFTTQLEYRQPLFWRLGASAFIATGRVGGQAGDLWQLSGYRVAYGIGGRFTFDQQEHINARLDIAYSDVDGWNYYFTIREAF